MSLPMPDAGPVPVEPCCVWRMLVNGWPEAAVAHTLHMTPGNVIKAEQAQNTALRDVDQRLIADPYIDRKKLR